MAAAAKEEEDKLAMLQGGRTLELRLAEALLRPKKGEGIGSGVGKQAVVRAVDLLRSWDANADGSISRQEFRDAMLKLGLEDVDIEEANALFDQYDNDGSGVLELDELRAAIPRMQEMMGSIQGQVSKLSKSSVELKARSEQARQALKLLEEANKQQANLLRLREKQPLIVKLGVYLAQRNLSAQQLLRSWDSNGDGEISKIEFRQHVKKIGLVAE